MVPSPRFDIPPGLSLPPLGCCRGTRPSQAESCRPERTRASSPDEMKTAIVDAFGQSGPSVIEVPVGVMPDPWDWIVGTRGRPAEPE